MRRCLFDDQKACASGQNRKMVEGDVSMKMKIVEKLKKNLEDAGKIVTIQYH